MSPTANFIAADLGASSGRMMVGQWNGHSFSLSEVHRFWNGSVRVAGHLYWDVLRLWSEMQTGLANYRAQFESVPAAIGVDAWGVDFGLLDTRGKLVGNPYHYRDWRTDGVPASVTQQIEERNLFMQTGVQTMQINTLFQLYSMVHTGDPQLQCAGTLLMIPDLFHYFLCGVRAVEYTEATTTQMYALESGWAKNLLERLEIPVQILPEVVTPGTQLESVRPEILQGAGFAKAFPVVAVASHDTASAVAAIPNMDANSAFISSGTWSLMGVELPHPIITDEAFRLGFTNEGGAAGSVLFVKNLTGLWLLQECLRQWMNEGQPYTWSDMMSMASAAEPFICVLDVEAGDFLIPKHMPQAIANYCHRTGQPEPGNPGAIARCCFESLSLKYRMVLESLESLTGRPVETLRVVGGGCRNALLCQMTADACNQTVVSGPAEASAFGNVMLQAIATGHLQHVEEGRHSMAQSIQCTMYSPHRTAAWDEAYERLKQLHSTICA